MMEIFSGDHYLGFRGALGIKVYGLGIKSFEFRGLAFRVGGIKGIQGVLARLRR